LPAHAKLPDCLSGPPNLVFHEHWGVLSRRVKWPKREADHSTSSDKVKYE
jgi:hypothetical protein